jgi:hypothetical protein
MRPLRQLAFLVEEFSTPSAAQQLLDRFLIGYPRDGGFHRMPDLKISVHPMLNGGEPDFASRVRDFGLAVASTPEKALADADAVVIVPRRAGAVANEGFLKIALEHSPAGAACFVHGVLSNSLDRARDLLRLAATRNISLLAGTPLAMTWRLPEVDLAAGTPLHDALIVVQGSFPEGELHALEGLLPVIEKRRGGETGVVRARFVEGKELWRAGEQARWSRDLLAAALSRSHSPQGDSVADGRTQDIYGLRLVPQLARDPRGWLLEHRDGLRSALLVLDGAVADFNFAVRATDGTILSAQLFRAPPPVEQHYSRLAAVVEDFFAGRSAPWKIERNLLITGLLEHFRQPVARAGRWIALPV